MQNSLQFIKCAENRRGIFNFKSLSDQKSLAGPAPLFFSFFYFSSHMRPDNSPAAHFFLSFILQPNSLCGPVSFPARGLHRSAPQPTLLSPGAAHFLGPFLPSMRCCQWLSPAANPMPNSGLTRQPDPASPCSCSSRRSFIPFRFKCHRSRVGFHLEIRFGSSPRGL
jgi:hypothetical protein